MHHVGAHVIFRSCCLVTAPHCVVTGRPAQQSNAQKSTNFGEKANSRAFSQTCGSDFAFRTNHTSGTDRDGSPVLRRASSSSRQPTGLRCRGRGARRSCYPSAGVGTHSDPWRIRNPVPSEKQAFRCAPCTGGGRSRAAKNPPVVDRWVCPDVKRFGSRSRVVQRAAGSVKCRPR